MRRSSLSMLVCLLSLVGAAGCGSSDGGPREGYWVGDHLSFQVRDGSVVEPGTLKVSCKGEGDCFAEGNRFFPEVELAIWGGEFSGTLEPPLGTVEIQGVFQSDTYATGTYLFQASGGCCSVLGTWRAEFLKPYEVPEDASGGDGVGLDGDGGTDVAERPQEGLYPPSATPEQIAAIERVNEIRGWLQIPFVKEIESLNKAAQAHAEYFTMHCQQYQKSGLSPHSEDPSWPEGFVGKDFFDRMKHFGFSGSPGWEVMAFQGNPIAAIDGWMETLYHRIPFVHPNTLEAGYGMTSKGCYTWSSGADVMDFSRTGSTPVKEPVAYPYDGQKGVPPRWMGWESPQPPLPPGHTYPSGPVITLTFPAGGQFKISGHQLLDPQGQAVKHQWVEPATDPAGFLEETVAMYSLSPLANSTSYGVRISGTWKGQEREWKWTFETGVAPAY